MNNIKNTNFIVESPKIAEGITIGLLKFKKSTDAYADEYIQVPCGVIKDGTEIIRVINDKGLFNAFGRKQHGAQRVPGLPAAIGSKTIASFMSAEDLKLLQPITYKYLGKHLTGYNADALITIIKAYLRAEEAGKIKPQQIAALKQAKIMLLDLAGQRIKDIIDKATGFFYEEEINAMDSLITKMYVNNEPLTQMAKRFSVEFYQQVFRIHDWKFNSSSSKRPGYVGTFTNKYVYNLLPDAAMDKVKANKERNSGKGRFYHYLTVDTGIPELDDILKEIIIVMKISKDKKEFQHNYKIAFEDKIKNKNSIRPLQLATISNIRMINSSN